MLKSLFQALKQEFALGNSKEILFNCYAILHLLEQEYTQDGNARDAAIDTICALLQKHKSQVQPVAPVVPEVNQEQKPQEA